VCWTMGKNAPSDRNRELRVEKLFLRRDLVEKLDSGRLLGLEDFVSFMWHMHPSYVSDISATFLRELLEYKHSGRRYTQDDWRDFTKRMSRSKSSRDVMLAKLVYLGLVEKVNSTQFKYEIIVTDKWIHYLELLARSWIAICENEQAGKL